MQTLIFEIAYFGLTAVMILLLGYTLLASIKSGPTGISRLARRQGLGMELTMAGFIISLATGVFLDTLSKSRLIGDLIYQQIHYTLFYFGFALLLFGIDASLGTSLPPGKNLVKCFHILLWGLYFLATAIALFFLFTPATYTITRAGGIEHYAQQRVFFLPLFYTFTFGATGLTAAAGWVKDRRQRPHLLWFGLACAWLLAGLLREATLIPSSGNPLVDLLVAFVPFTLGSACLCLSLRALRRANRSESGPMKA